MTSRRAGNRWLTLSAWPIVKVTFRLKRPRARRHPAATATAAASGNPTPTTLPTLRNGAKGVHEPDDDVIELAGCRGDGV